MKQKYFLLFGVYFVLSIILVGLFRDLFHTSTGLYYRQVEETYIEESYSDEFHPESDNHIHAKAYNDTLFQYYREKFFRDKKNAIRIFFIPREHEKHISSILTRSLTAFLYHETILRSISGLHVLLYEDEGASRGTMKGKTIRLHQVDTLADNEALAVAIHEFAHYYDIHSLRHKFGSDISDIFYDISWNDATQMKAGLGQDDFVSGYAMTNRYEDFAESYTFFVLHNDLFLQKTQKSPILLEKYTFFREYVFHRGFFQDIDALSTESLKEYYWDTTKTPFDVKKFLQYVEGDV